MLHRRFEADVARTHTKNHFLKNSLGYFGRSQCIFQSAKSEARLEASAADNNTLVASARSDVQALNNLIARRDYRNPQTARDVVNP